MTSPQRTHRPTSIDGDPRAIRRGRRGGRSADLLGVGLLILAAACGGSDDDTGVDAEEVAPGTEPAATNATEVAEPTEPEATEPAATNGTEPETSESEATEPEPDTTDAGDTDAERDSTDASSGGQPGRVPSAEWAETMIDAWATYLSARFEVVTTSMEAQRRGEHFFDVTRVATMTEAEALDDYATALDSHADDPTLDASADPLRAVVAEMVARTRTVSDLGEDDPERIRQEIDEAEAADPGSLPATAWGDAFVAYRSDELSARLDAACFDLQDALSAAGYGLVDCTGSSIEIPPTGEVLQPGVHELTEFVPGLSLELTEPTTVFEASDFVEISDPDGTVSADFLDIDEVVDPSGLADPDNDATMPLPEDLGPWLTQFPISVLAEGTVETATGPAPYWDLQVDGARMAEMMSGGPFLQLATYAENDSYGSFSFIGGPPVSEEHFILVDWRRGEDRILVYGIAEQGEPLFAWIQTMLAATG